MPFTGVPQINALPLLVVQDSAAQFFFPATDGSNAPIDCTVGFKAALMAGTLAQIDKAGWIAEFGPERFQYLNTGVLLNLSPADINNIHTGQWIYQVNLTDDDWVNDIWLIASGALQVVPSIFATP